MGGFASLNEVDISFSRTFLKEATKLLPRFKFEEVLDCGAGIGRITKELLSNLFKTVGFL
jgi:16S rRNA A1518/A1519 N6-dimethyltransferase RsmA/KsgA/DIM1 with predicted DNA glycosylase/AP lyase activity